MTVLTELLELTNVKPYQPDAESVQGFLKRLYEKADRVDEATWATLSDGVQHWINDAGTALNKKRPVPLPEGFGDEPVVEEPAAPAPSQEPPAAAAAEPEVEPAEEEEEEEEPAAPPEPEPAEEPPAATKKKAAKTKVAKKAKAKAAPRTAKAKKVVERRGRPLVFTPEAKIKLLVKDNPFRKGTNAYKVFNMYKPGMTVGEFEKQVAKGAWQSTPKMFLQVHRGRGLIAINS